MRLNYDCVRDVLLSLECLIVLKCSESGSCKLYSTNHRKVFEDLCNSEKHYSMEDVIYTIKMLDEGNLISAKALYGDGKITNYIVFDITYEGHQFLQNIRPKTVWDKSQSVFKNIGTVSIDIIKTVASAVISDMIKHYLP